MLIKKSFKLKLILSYAAVVFVSLGFFAFFLDRNLEKNSLQEIKSSLLNQAYLVESQIPKESLIKKDLNSLQEQVKSLGSKISCRITIVGSTGEVLADSEKLMEELPKMENHLDRPEIKSALFGGIGEIIRYSSTIKTDMLYIAVPIPATEGRIIGSVRLALPLVNVRGVLLTVRKTIFLALLFALGFAFLIGSVLSAGIIKPINKIILVSRKFAAGDFKKRIYHDAHDEVGELALTLNKMAQDIEDKVKEVNTQNQHLKAILNSMIEGVIVIDNKGKVVSVNPTIEKIFQVSKAQVEEKDFLEGVRNNEINEIVVSVIKEGKLVSGEIALNWPVQRIFQVNASPLFSQEAISGCLLVIHDITEIRRLETMRRDFVANVSHELKTPLTSIKGFVETLLEGAIDDKENNRHFLEIIKEHADRLDTLISDLLDLSALESREIGPKKEKFNLHKLTQDILSGFKSQLKKKNIEAKNDLPVDLTLSAEKDKIEQVLVNLIDNAIKFNREKGKIMIYSEDSAGGIKVTVEDSGIGIAEKDAPRIFERFYRVDKGRLREMGGTGLGLSIVKHIIELHGGNVAVESIEGLGSKFFFILPK